MGQAVQGVVGVGGHRAVHVRHGDRATIGIVPVEGAAAQDVDLLRQVPGGIVLIGHCIARGVGGLYDAAHTVVGVGNGHTLPVGDGCEVP